MKRKKENSKNVRKNTDGTDLRRLPQQRKQANVASSKLPLLPPWGNAVAIFSQPSILKKMIYVGKITKNWRFFLLEKSPKIEDNFSLENLLFLLSGGNDVDIVIPQDHDDGLHGK